MVRCDSSRERILISRDPNKRLDEMLNFTSTDGSKGVLRTLEKKPDIPPLTFYEPLPGAPYDVWAVHSKYNSVLFDEFMPSTRRVLSIIRDP